MPKQQTLKKLVRSMLDHLGIAVLRHHYYSPVMFPSDLRTSLSAPRRLPGLRFNVEQQLALLRNFTYRDELLDIPIDKPDVHSFGYHNGAFESGDAEMLYSMIRHFKPRRFLEIGCGQSSLMARLAQARNRQEAPDYSCQHVCVEPFEQPWLEEIGVEVIRDRIECVDTAIVESLERNDILFIDSSHVIRP